MKQLLFALIVLFAAPIACCAQLSKDEMAKYLTNGKKRTWILEKYTSTLGSCSGTGQSFEFWKDGKLAWKRCKNGEPEYKELTWVINEVANALSEYMIVFSEPLPIGKNGEKVKSLRIDFKLPKLNASNTEMKWRLPTRKNQVELQFQLLSKN